MFFLGMFIGGILGVFLISILTVGKISDCESHEEYLRKQLEFRMHGDKNADD